MGELRFRRRSRRCASGTRLPSAGAGTYVELYRSERWRRYYSEEDVPRAACATSIQNVETWEQDP